MGLPYNDITEATGSHFQIQKISGSILFTYNDSWTYTDDGYVEHFCSDYTGSYSSVLIGGLGVGCIPQWFASQGTNVTVIEKDQELIDEIVSQGYLSQSISIIQGDIFTHAETGSHDMILFDIWFDESQITPEIQQQLNTSYSGSSNNIYYALL